VLVCVPKVRRVVHFGPPQTVEQYFQEVGRAGRDGLEAECTLIANDTEFNKYNDDFYTARLTPEVKASRAASLNALRAFAADSRTCRRLALLRHFSQASSFGQRCGTCDNCRRCSQGAQGSGGEHGGLRDLTSQALCLLEAARLKGGLAAGKLVDAAHSFGQEASLVELREAAKAQKLLGANPGSAPRPFTKELLKEIIPGLVGEGFLSRTQKSFQTAEGRGVNYEVLGLTPKGGVLLRRAKEQAGGGSQGGSACKVWLAPPPGLLALEAAHEAKAAAKRAADRRELEQAGVPLEHVPESELEQGSGPCLAAFQHWVRTLKHLRESGRNARADALEGLRDEVLAWRSETAAALGMAPGAVLAEHLALKIAYAQTSDPESLRAAGVRIRGVDVLAQRVADFAQANGLSGGALSQGQSSQGGGACGGAGGSQGGPPGTPFQLPVGSTPPPGGAWPLAVYKAGKGGAKPPWEVSWERFQLRGERPEAIALSQASGRPVATRTVLGHVLRALLFGREVDLARLAGCPPGGLGLPGQLSQLTNEEWLALDQAEALLRLDVVANDKFPRKDLVLQVLYVVLADDAEALEKAKEAKPETKSEEQKQLEAAWYEKVDWWFHLKAAGFRPGA